LYEILTTGVSVQQIGSIPTVTPRRTRITGLDAVLKGAIDYVLAAVLLVLLCPVVVAVAVVVRFDSPGPILHRRRVLGVTGKSFDAFKFRTMVLNAERRQTQRPIGFTDRRLAFKAKADPRITRVGRFLRRTSLDELPQLFNVLCGDMSLVGPRMIAPDEAARYGKFQRNLVTVKPGITGPWQVEGRSDLPYEQRVRLSMEYIRNYTFWTDIAILLRTVLVVLRGRGAY
jgi:lipopolysaccharide/colanic/teichoic acid biosynthesis glycosyltransferase